jgi:outer membrane lipoprotein SlyB
MTDMGSLSRKGGLLYPMLVIAAITVIVFSVTGIATMMGWMPAALSGKEPAPAAVGGTASESDTRSMTTAPRPAATNQRGPGTVPSVVTRAAAACGECGIVESIRAVETQGQGSLLGAAGGAIVGGLLGSQLGHGRGRAVTTVAGAGAGAYAGNEIEKHMTRSVRYQVRVRMENGTARTFYRATPPELGVGQKVRITEKGLAAAG